jgi:hypothetical protein
MNKVALILLFVSAIASAQTEVRDTIFVRAEEVDTILANVPTPVFSMGILGGITFINPEAINKQIEFSNSVFNSSETPIRRLAQWSVWFTFRPKNMSSFFSLRGEFLTTSRTFCYTGIVTNNTGNTTNSFDGTVTSRYTVVPFSISTGTFITKMMVKGEIGFTYAIASIKDKTDMGSYGSSENSYDADGYGFRAALQQVIPIDRVFGINIEACYRFLRFDDFRDSKGRQLNDFEVNYNGITLMIGLSYGF